MSQSKFVVREIIAGQPVITSFIHFRSAHEYCQCRIRTGATIIRPRISEFGQALAKALEAKKCQA